MSDPALTQAATDIKWIAARFKGLLAAGDALDQFGSIENAIAEAKGRLADHSKQEELAKTRALQITAEATAAAGEIGKKAAGDYENAIKNASVEAALIKASATEVAQQHVQKQAKLKELDGAILSREREHEQMLTRIEAAKAEHAQILKVIGDLKAKFA
jgi:chromosome segregation ATPase